PVSQEMRRRYDDDDDFEESDLSSIPRRRRGYYSTDEAVKAAALGLTCSLISLALLVAMFVIWITAMQSPRMRFGGGPDGSMIAVILLVAVVSIVLAIVSIVYSSRGHDPSNAHKRGQATAGLVCGIVALVL